MEKGSVMSLFVYMSQSMFNFDALTPDFMWYALESIGVRAESGFLPPQ
ncbi:YihE protein [Vibrio sp. JCM 18904]|nr:YihE protein [Vibrio sp. JCM 18904]